MAGKIPESLDLVEPGFATMISDGSALQSYHRVLHKLMKPIHILIASMSQKIRKEDEHKSSVEAERWEHKNWNLYLSVLWTRLDQDPYPGGQNLSPQKC